LKKILHPFAHYWLKITPHKDIELNHGKSEDPGDE
jgi:hypothetical protein